MARASPDSLQQAPESREDVFVRAEPWGFLEHRAGNILETRRVDRELRKLRRHAERHHEVHQTIGEGALVRSNGVSCPAEGAGERLLPRPGRRQMKLETG